MKIFLLLLMFVCGNALCDVPQATEKKKEANKAVQENPKTDEHKPTAPIPITINDTGSTQSSDNTCHPNNCDLESHNWLDKFLSDPVATFTGFLFFATLGLIATGIIQWRAMRSQEASQHRIERAYVFVEVQLNTFTSAVTSAVFQTTEIGSTKATVQFWNYGKTPAVVTMIRGYIDVARPSPQGLIDATGTELPLPPSLGIATNNTYPVTLEKVLSLDELAEVSRLGKRIFFVGKMEYLDINNRPCVTGFCWELVYRTTGSFLTISRDSALNKRT
jgi:hypothetical protein